MGTDKIWGMIAEQFLELILSFGNEWEVVGVEGISEMDEVDIFLKYIGQAKFYDKASVRRSAFGHFAV